MGEAEVVDVLVPLAGAGAEALADVAVRALGVLGLDVANSRISNHVPEVLKQVKACMENLPQNLKAQNRARISILVHVIKSILQNL